MSKEISCQDFEGIEGCRGWSYCAEICAIEEEEEPPPPPPPPPTPPDGGDDYQCRSFYSIAYWNYDDIFDWGSGYPDDFQGRLPPEGEDSKRSAGFNRTEHFTYRYFYYFYPNGDIYYVEIATRSSDDYTQKPNFVGNPYTFNPDSCSYIGEIDNDDGGGDDEGEPVIGDAIRSVRNCLNVEERGVNFVETDFGGTFLIEVFSTVDDSLLGSSSFSYDTDKEKVCSVFYVYLGDCAQIIIRRKHKKYRICTVTRRLERVERTPNVIDPEESGELYQYRVRQVGNLLKVVFPGKTITSARYRAFSQRTLTSKAIGKYVYLIDQNGKPLIEEGSWEGVRGLVYGETYTISDEFLATIRYPIFRSTITWENGGEDLIKNPDEGLKIYWEGHTQIIGTDDFDTFRIDNGEPDKFEPDNYWGDLEPEDFNIVELKDTTITRAEIGEYEPIPDTYSLTKAEVRFYNGDTLEYTDYLFRGSEDKTTWIEDEFEFNNKPCPIYEREERDFMAAVDELKPIVLDLCNKFDELNKKVTRIDGAISSVSFPATAWTVPTIGLGDPALGTVNEYEPSEQGLQNAFNQMALLFQGLGLTVAHNKSVLADLGMAIGATNWREEYQVPKKAVVPKSLRKTEGEEEEEKELENLTELFQWYIEQFDELIGQFDSEFEIEDADLTQEGDQKIKLTINNIAEGLTEIWGAAIMAMVNSELLVQISSKAMVEAGQAKKSSAVNFTYLQSIAGYLGFNQKDITFDTPLSFTPDKDRMHELLKNTNCPSAGIAFDDKENLQGQLLNLQQAAAIIRAKNFSAFGKSTDQDSLKKSIVKRIKDIAKDQDIFRKGKQDFDEFIKEVEEGFAQSSADGTSIWRDGQKPKVNELEIPEKEE